MRFREKGVFMKAHTAAREFEDITARRERKIT